MVLCGWSKSFSLLVYMAQPANQVEGEGLEAIPLFSIPALLLFCVSSLNISASLHFPLQKVDTSSNEDMWHVTWGCEHLHVLSQKVQEKSTSCLITAPSPCLLFPWEDKSSITTCPVMFPPSPTALWLCSTVFFTLPLPPFCRSQSCTPTPPRLRSPVFSGFYESQEGISIALCKMGLGYSWEICLRSLHRLCSRFIWNVFTCEWHLHVSQTPCAPLTEINRHLQETIHLFLR